MTLVMIFSKEYSSFFYTIAAIFATLMALSFSILLNSLQSLSNKYNSYKIIERFFRDKNNKYLYIITSLGIISSLILAVSLFDDKLFFYFFVFELLLLVFVLELIYITYGDFVKLTNPTLLINSPLNELVKSCNSERKKEIKLKFLEEIKEITINSPKYLAEKILTEIQLKIKSIEKAEDKDLLNSYIKEIGKLWAKKSSSVPFTAIKILLSPQKRFIQSAKKNNDEFLINNTINYSRDILFEIERYQNRDIDLNEIKLLFLKFYLYAKKLKEENQTDVLSNLINLMEQAYNLSKELGFNEKQKAYLEKRFDFYFEEIGKLNKV